MKATMLVVGLVMTMGGVTVSQVKAGSAEAAAPVRVSNRFEFVVEAPMERAAPLFGPEGERCWAGERWDPKFVYPQPVKDEEGAVFTVLHGGQKSVWVISCSTWRVGGCSMWRWCRKRWCRRSMCGCVRRERRRPG